MLGNLHVRFGVGAGVKFPGLHHFILAREGQSYASLRFHVGPGGTVPIPACVDYSRPFAASDRAAWEQQYLAGVELCPPILNDSPAPWFPSAEEDAIDW